MTSNGFAGTITYSPELHLNSLVEVVHHSLARIEQDKEQVRFQASYALLLAIGADSRIDICNVHLVDQAQLHNSPHPTNLDALIAGQTTFGPRKGVADIEFHEVERSYNLAGFSHPILSTELTAEYRSIVGSEIAPNFEYCLRPRDRGRGQSNDEFHVTGRALLYTEAPQFSRMACPCFYRLLLQTSRPDHGLIRAKAVALSMATENGAASCREIRGRLGGGVRG
jgi:hypothetical protein